MARMKQEWVWAIVSLAIAILLAYILLSLSKDAQSESNLPPVIRSQYDQRLLALDIAGIEAAYQEQVKLLFMNWMKDPNVGQPRRALTGLRNAAKAYIEAMNGAKQREEELRVREP